MSFRPGAHLGRYEILALIGSGGMGEVYRARDKRLGRDVAIKVLPDRLSRDRHYRRRLEREAKTVSQLQHPHICTLFDFDTAHGTDFLVMEYLAGETLGERLQEGPLSVEDVCTIGRQVAGAVDVAHRKGLVHRDLKPANVMLTSGGAKVLDFGLAKEAAPPLVDAETRSPTQTLPLTTEGSLLGTMPYMAPEQLEGKPADVRTDIWALGCLLYEMSTGERPFHGETQASLIGSILKGDPEAPSRKQPVTPKQLDHVVRRCLEKDPARRPSSAKDLVADLSAIEEARREAVSPGVGAARTLSEGAAGASASGPRRRIMLIAAGVLLLFALGVGSWMLIVSEGGSAGAESPTRIGSLAVLPLDNLSGDPEQDYFSDGMTGALIAELAQVSSLRVTSRTSVMRYKEAAQPLRQIAGELGVEAVLEGTVFRDADRIRITLQLIDARADRNLWSRSYERDLRDVLKLQGEVARAVAREVAIELTPDEERRLLDARAVDPESHDAYLRGMHHVAAHHAPDALRAIEYFQEAIARDPGHAPAHAAMAYAYLELGWGLHGLPAQEAWPKARRAAERALELDPSMGYAHMILGLIHGMYDWEWERGEAELRLASELSPNDGDVLASYGEYLCGICQCGAGRRFIEKAVSLGRLDLNDRSSLLMSLWFQGKHALVIEEAKKILEIDSDLVFVLWPLARSYEALGRNDEWLEVYSSWMRRDGRSEQWIRGLRLAFKEGGRVGAARYETEVEPEEARLLSLARAYEVIGDLDSAFDVLERAADERTPSLAQFLGCADDWAPFRADPRGGALLRRMNFPVVP